MDPIVNPERAAAFQIIRFDPDHLRLKVEWVHRAVGLRPDRPQHRRWMEQVHDLAQLAPRILRPRTVYRIDEVRRLEPQHIKLVSNAVFDGGAGRFLRHSQFVATFVVTIGSALERLSRRWLRAGQVMRGTIVDALASAYVEATAECCQEHIRAWALPQGLDVTPRYSPGYCGMPVSQQVPLFQSVPANRVSVHLTESCLMVPIKSVSGLIGIGPADRLTPTDYPCRHCDHPHCTHRRVPFEPTRGGCCD